MWWEIPIVTVAFSLQSGKISMVRGYICCVVEVDKVYLSVRLALNPRSRTQASLIQILQSITILVDSCPLYLFQDLHIPTPLPYWLTHHYFLLLGNVWSNSEPLEQRAIHRKAIQTINQLIHHHVWQQMHRKYSHPNRRTKNSTCNLSPSHFTWMHNVQPKPQTKAPFWHPPTRNRPLDNPDRHHPRQQTVSTQKKGLLSSWILTLQIM